MDSLINYSKDIESILEEIDVSDTNYKKAKKSYRSIAEWIQREESKVACYDPDIYIQGSMKLGTAIKPITEEGSYDVDIVCVFNGLSKNDISQSDLKKLLGNEIISYSNSKSMKNIPKNGKRCWTINYADESNFHIDILPSVPEKKSYELILEEYKLVDNITNEAISLTDKDSKDFNSISQEWEISNPKGYYEWFRNISKYNYYKENLSKSMNMSIEEIPSYKVKTPLQRIIQILKRHAEVEFSNDIEFKPSSIIITTLATKSYESYSISGKISFSNLLSFITNDIVNHIDTIHGSPTVLNPVNPDEVLSGKWSKDKKYFEEFLRWVNKAKKDFNFVQKSGTFSLNESDLRESLNLSKKVEGYTNIKKVEEINEQQNLQGFLLTVPHHRRHSWIERITESIEIKAYYKINNKWTRFFSGQTVAKHRDLKFEVVGNKSFFSEVHWQVTNTGEEADRENSLRGGFYSSEIIEGKKVRLESTLYQGIHFVEVYIVKNNICIGKSLPFMVKIE
ncbi:MAG: nucleotidyltransferase [Vagococcus fluvialis]